ncbi:hypothetical protein OHT57_29655 [Streptomyces sp. NBC_00285]|uniref:hypothetical protein n=1 Tax=Streptomyces sp. NBC_00285 TaxID=2975700 RepID=UPI002E2A5AF1|nr:hypothetical protein [Streptomyces sp. NBC_00285]
MSRLSRDKKLDDQRGATPIDVRVPVTGEAATVAGTPVAAPPGEDLHQTVLTHLHRLAVTAGRPVNALIHDARIGWVVPLEVTTDGSSRFTAEPVRMAPTEGTGSEPRTMGPSVDERQGPRATGPSADERQGPGEAAHERNEPSPTVGSGAPEPTGLVPRTSWPPAGGPAEPDRHVPLLPPEESGQDPAPTFRMRKLPAGGPAESDQHVPLLPPEESAQDPAPTFRMRTLPAAQPADAGASPTHVLRQLPEPQAPGTAVAPTGEFGPPPVMDVRPSSTPEPLPPADAVPAPGPLPSAGPAPKAAPAWSVADPTPLPLPTEPGPAPALRPLPPAGFADVPQPLPSAQPTPRPGLFLDPGPLLDDPDPKPTPVRGFDAVAEAVLGEGLVVDEAVLVEPVARISEAVQEGRTEAAAELAERTVTQASDSLGGEHPDVLRVRELAAYIAYLGGEPIRAAEISLDLAAIQHRTGDAEAAYGNVQSAATAWKAVRDPLQGLALGRELLTLWTDMAAGEGPAADDRGKLESARARMLRLAERARTADQ